MDLTIPEAVLLLAIDDEGRIFRRLAHETELTPFAPSLTHLLESHWQDLRARGRWHPGWKTWVVQPMYVPIGHPEAMQGLYAAAWDEGVRVFVECGPRPILSGAGARTEPSTSWTGALHPDHDDRERLLTSLGTLFLRGLDPRWRAVHRGAPLGVLPPYPFQRRRHWLEAVQRREDDGAHLPLLRVDWVRASPGVVDLDGNWVVVGNPGGLGGALQSRLHDHGLDAHCSPAVQGRKGCRVVAFVERGIAGMERVVQLLAKEHVEQLTVVVTGSADDPEVTMLEGLAAGVALLRLSPRGLFRWHTSCCNTPIGNTATGPGMAFVGLVHTFVDHSEHPREEVMGPPRGRVHGRFIPLEQREGCDAHPKASVGLLAATAAKLAAWKLSGKARGVCRGIAYMILE